MKYLLLGITLLQFGLTHAQIENGMVAHFPLNGNYNDISPSGLTGTATGSVFGPDRSSIPNGAVEFAGNGSIAFSSSLVKVDFPLTISVWAKFNSFNQFNQIFCSDSEFNNYSGYWFQTVASTGQPSISFGGGLGVANSSNRRTFISDIQLQTGVWYHIVGIIRAYNDMDIYIDCEETTGTYSGTGSTTMAYFPSGSTIGSSPGNNGNPNGGFYDGSIDQLVIWNRELTTSEITFMCDIKNTLALPIIEQAPKERELRKPSKGCCPCRRTNSCPQ